MGRRRRVTLTVVAIAVTALMTAAPMARAIPFLTPKVTIEYDHAAQLSRRTYSWGEVRMAVPGYVDRLKAAVDKNLQRKGWQLVPSNGNMTVFALGDIRSEQQVTVFYSTYGNGYAPKWGLAGLGPGWKPGYGQPTLTALSVAGNNLVLDIFDSGSHQLVFRGVMENDLSNTDKKNDKRLSKYVKQLFKKFPPKG